MNVKFSPLIIGRVLAWSTILSVVLPAEGKPQGTEAVGFVSQVKGDCWLQRGRSREKLTMSKHGGAWLRAGDKVRCDKGASLVLELRSLRTTIEPSDRWTTIPRVLGSRSDPMAGPVDDWFKLAGGLRSVPIGIYSPPGGGIIGAVQADHFLIRWIARRGVDAISFRLRDESGKQLWPEDSGQGVSVPSALGELSSEDARQAILKYQKSDENGHLILLVIDSRGNENDVRFSVVSHLEEEMLERRLNTCNGQSDLMQYICRAYYLRQVRLFSEAAEEYDAALHRLAPRSVDLQLHAIVAHRLSGNYSRERELIDKLPPGIEVPE